jgi:ADP-ribose pyrophosphatase YjhB (NUDIX family)
MDIVYGCICINPSGEILLVRGRSGSKWSFPKGHREQSDTSELMCARRELMEEAGVNAPEKYHGTIKLRAATYFVFLFDNNTLTRCIINDKKEVDMAQWFPVNELPDSGNVDVSMFKNLIKLYRNVDSTNAERTLKYITSDYAINKFQDMNKRLERKAEEKKEQMEQKNIIIQS